MDGVLCCAALYMSRGGSFTFSFDVPTSYPHEAPKVKCKTKVRVGTCCSHEIRFGTSLALEAVLYQCLIALQFSSIPLHSITLCSPVLSIIRGIIVCTFVLACRCIILTLISTETCA